ncbi:hypothetical protein D0866_06755 [Hortaea werneckii]|uniref:PHD-type domain-containing protein n=2 Tax=Hortaea werneckii TaxID=91943 RepID=A0A3M7AXL8_HORWE|nr:hypothetical protein D0866_06755 [Hortaea werneckii]
MEPPAHNEAPAFGDAVPPPAEESSKPPQVATDVPQAEEPVATGKEQQELSPQDEEVTIQVKSQTPGEETAGEPSTRDVETSQKTSRPPDHTDSSTMLQWDAAQKEAGEAGSHAQETAPPPKRRGRGRPRGRPPGRGRGASRGAGTGRVAGATRGGGVGRPASGRGGGRGGKRKRDERDDGDGDSSDSEVTTPAATMTKSGRNIQKRTSFVFAPPQEQSPTAATPPAFPKRKRAYRRNPETAVCKVCLRGTSPATNMIVFCDGCNTPYHRFCHHQPIDQSVIDEVDKEWYCKQCQSQRVRPVPESEVSHFVAAGHAPPEQRQRYFTSLPQGLLITLLTKATTLHPDLPLFSPDFHARSARTSTGVNQPTIQLSKEPIELHEESNATTSEAIVATQQKATDEDAGPATANHSDDGVEEDDDAYPDHPPTYPRPGFGLMRQLPPDREDLQWLVEDDDKYGVFTHMYQVDSQAANGAAQDGSDQ